MTDIERNAIDMASTLAITIESERWYTLEEYRHDMVADIRRLVGIAEDRIAWSDVAAESNRAIDAYLREVDPTLPEHYGMPVDGIRRVVAGIRNAATERGLFLAALDGLAAAVAVMHPSAVVGLGAGVADGEWCIYMNARPVIIGHGSEGVGQAMADLGRSDWSARCPWRYGFGR